MLVDPIKNLHSRFVPYRACHEDYFHLQICRFGDCGPGNHEAPIKSHSWLSPIFQSATVIQAVIGIWNTRQEKLVVPLSSVSLMGKWRARETGRMRLKMR